VRQKAYNGHNVGLVQRPEPTQCDARPVRTGPM
jgi:hypothetical protein